MTTDTSAPEAGTANREPNDPDFKCATCGHKAVSHADHGFGRCQTKTCQGKHEEGCQGFVFEGPPDDGGSGMNDADGDDVRQEKPPTPETTTEEIPPDDTDYDPTRPFDPSQHMRVLEHKNRQQRVVARSHYLDVKWRIAWLRSPTGVVEGYLDAHPTWRIESEPLMDIGEMVQKGFALFRARLWDTDGADEIGELVPSTHPGRMIAEAHGSEDKDDWKDFIEKAETKAVGRCLANAGYGTAAAAEFEEGERIADAGVDIGGSRGGMPEGVPPPPDCPHGHGSGPVIYIASSKVGTTKGQPIYWCGQKLDSGKKCGWVITVAAYKERLENLKRDDPGDPNAPQREEGPPPGESRTGSSASAPKAGPSSTGSPGASSSGRAERPTGADRQSRPAQPKPNESRPPASAWGPDELKAFQEALATAKLQIPDVARAWNIRPNGEAFGTLAAEHSWTPEELVENTVARMAAD